MFEAEGRAAGRQGSPGRAPVLPRAFVSSGGDHGFSAKPWWPVKILFVTFLEELR